MRNTTRPSALTAFAVLLLWAGPALAVQTSTATGNSIEYNETSGLAVIEGNAKVETASGTVTADRIKVNTLTRDGHAEGNVVLVQTSGTITAREAHYNWAASTGVILDATAVSDPWRFSASTMNQAGPDVFTLENGDITSCDHDPPHYTIPFERAKVRMGKRARLNHARLRLDEAPVLYAPYYARSLVPKKYSLRIEPGSSGRDGLITRSSFGYPFTPNTHTRFKWDWFERTGNGVGAEHRYFRPDLQGRLDTYFVQDNNPDPAPQSERWAVLWSHFQKLLPRLTVNAKLDAKSDQTVGNQFSGAGNQVRVENQTRGLLSEAGLTYQFDRATLQAQFDRRDRFDSLVSSEAFVGKVTLPRFTFNTAPLRTRILPFYTTFNADYANETQDRFDPSQTLRYQRTANLGTQISKDLRIRSYTLTPRFGFSERWRDRDTAVPGSEADVYEGRINGGADLRKRIRRLADVTLGYTRTDRLAKNSLESDTGSNDRGVEAEALTTSVVARIGRDSRLSLSSGYDLRQAPRDDPTKYDHTSERIRPPTVDLQWRLSRMVNFFFRETYSVFDTDAGRPVNTPLNTSGEIAYGEWPRSMLLSQGFSYSKTRPGQEAVLHLTNRLKCYLTEKWFIDAYVSYRAVGPEGLEYRKLKPTEKTVNVARDLHCWVLRMEFSQRTDRKEASFYIDLKANLSRQRSVFAETEDRFGPTRDTPEDVTDVFPVEAPARDDR